MVWEEWGKWGEGAVGTGERGIKCTVALCERNWLIGPKFEQRYGRSKWQGQQKMEKGK